jgi:hypothetical protein
VKVVAVVAIAGTAGAGVVVVASRHNAETTTAPVGLVATEAPKSATASATANANASANADDALMALGDDAGVKGHTVKVGGKNTASADVKDEGPQAETQLVTRAQDALRSNPSEALALCNDHAKRFPNGMLVQEREVIAIEALVKTGRTDEARRRADRFKARFPGSAAIRRIDVIVGN